MKKNKSTLIICVCLVLVIAVVAAVLFMTSKREGENLCKWLVFRCP